ncbi:hypothetical protein ACYFX5_24055 [Bremerella sp. T1]|uniref:hypothetical protein n=1 Tax=Bremerella sp. TYQ1 TaxID=3119568 RepID=UPI001CCF98CF|nr:hypothetical protein [Bremerella volcania]UBM36101.1 hypothetical protein LA756_26000 [Bremerella volcania]
MNGRKPLVQFSIAELVTVLTIGCLVVGAMWAHEIVSNLALLVAMGIVIGNLIVIAVARNQPRTFAIGFTLAAFSYAVLSLIVEHRIGETSEFRLDRELPTTKLWMELREPITREYFYLDDKLIPESRKPTFLEDGRTVVDKDGTKLGRVSSLGGSKLKIKESPSGTMFIRTGFVVWTLLLGYLGGKFAVGFRRYQDRQSIEPKPQDSSNLS